MYHLKKVKVILWQESERDSFYILKENLEQEAITLTFANEEEEGGEGVLWITDSVLRAGKLLERKEAVLIFLNDTNCEADFSNFRYALEDPARTEVEYLEQVYRRLYNIPWDILETDRCFVRETIMEDVETFYQIYKEPAMTAYMDDLYRDHEQERQYIHDYIEKQYGFYGFGIWTVIEKATGDIIGRAGLSLREGFDELELGFLIGVPWQGKGFATEVCKAVLEYGKECLCYETIQALVVPENVASISVCEKIGLKKVEEVQVDGVDYIRFLG